MRRGVNGLGGRWLEKSGRLTSRSLLQPFSSMALPGCHPLLKILFQLAFSVVRVSANQIGSFWCHLSKAVLRQSAQFIGPCPCGVVAYGVAARSVTHNSSYEAKGYLAQYEEANLKRHTTRNQHSEPCKEVLALAVYDIKDH